MKKMNYFFAMSNLVKIAFAFGVLSFVMFGFAKEKEEKITICHTPPGNPGNCHEINISLNALQEHLDHGDRIFCDNLQQYSEMLELIGGDKAKLIMNFGQ